MQEFALSKWNSTCLWITVGVNRGRIVDDDLHIPGSVRDL